MIYNNAGICVSRARDQFSRVYKRDIKPDRDMSHLRLRHFSLCLTRFHDVHVIAHKYENEPTRDVAMMKGARQNPLKEFKMYLKPTHKYYDELIGYINDELSQYE